jgi:putative toxin-antitoxin system antitoxin component (TIGR02293 family)
MYIWTSPTVAPEVWSHALRIFGSEQKANRWMRTRLSELNDRTPEEVLTEDPANEAVETVLDRIEYGVFS